ncbi:MAG TPA: class I SAM-dependent methyltransferase [Gaiellaceae bacterium]|nr:class I SAM-dependent methyltransferase [Gaiellaceae bacterium]
MSFNVSGDAYDGFMGRYSRELAPAFADFADVAAGQRVLDVGCGTGVLTEELARRVGPENVAGADPSPMLAASAERVPGADLRQASAESLPWEAGSFDATLAQLVVHFMDDPARGVDEMARVTRPGGVVALSTWDFAGGGMELLNTFWQAVLTVAPGTESESSRYGDREQLDALCRARGLDDVLSEPIEVSSRYDGFDELWGSFRRGVGPAGQRLAAASPEQQEAIRAEYFARIGEPSGAFSLTGRAWAVRGRVPS